MATKHAASYKSLQADNDNDLLDEKHATNCSPDPSLSSGPKSFSKHRPQSSHPSFKVQDFRLGGYGELTESRLHSVDDETTSKRTLVSSQHCFALPIRSCAVDVWQFACDHGNFATVSSDISPNCLPQTYSDVYATYPFVSCVESLHLTTYRTMTALTVDLSLRQT